MTDEKLYSFKGGWGEFGNKQILGLILSFVISVAFIALGYSTTVCLGFFLVAIIMYMIPHLLKVESIKTMTVFGVLVLVVSIVIGAMVVAPGVVDQYDDSPDDSDHFSDIEYVYADGGVYVSATLKGTLTTDVLFYYQEVSDIRYTTFYVTSNNPTTAVMTVTGNAISGFVELNSDNLYCGGLGLAEDNGELDDDSVCRMTLFTDAFDGDVSSYIWKGCAYSAIFVAIVYFLILFFSAFMRKRFEITREKMEKEGRLYPKGYGRCKSCGGMVLPGEVNCRKCGAYIDVPEEMKPKKKDFFECSECGAEVPSDAKECPKCGAKFDEEEFIVEHADGTQEVTTEVFECSDCGAEVPITAKFCPKCGARFDEDEENNKN